MKTAFWIALGLLAYTYAGYFALLNVLAPVLRRFRRAHRVVDGHSPKVTMVISLHNEERLITERIENFLALEYPREQLELLLGDDCSTDRTRQIIREWMAKDQRIRLVEFDSHQGKTAVINQLVPMTSADLIVFTDANTFYEPDALRKMTRHFVEPRIGVVCGHMILRSPTGVNIEHNYWAAEATMKMRENDLGVVLGANGGIYVMRKHLFTPLRSDVIQIDDFIWPVRVYQQGCMGVYERDAVAYEEVSPTVEAEFRRKVRIGTGDYRALGECWRLLMPWKGWVAFAFWSHKVLRWLAPFLLVIVLVANAGILSSPIYRVLFGLQLLFYITAAAGRVLSTKTHFAAKLARIPYYFVGSNVALAVGCYKCLTGRQRAAWSQKAHRQG
jgi:cellulose synthase/poly-beta-1,6-N-acetylglucosamine synthase-like glycosyltransferase